MTNDNCRKFKENQIIFCTLSCVAESSRSIDFGEDRLRERGSLPATFFVLSRVFYMANDNSRKFKQNQMMFCILPCTDVYKRQHYNTQRNPYFFPLLSNLPLA